MPSSLNICSQGGPGASMSIAAPKMTLDSFAVELAVAPTKADGDGDVVRRLGISSDGDTAPRVWRIRAARVTAAVGWRDPGRLAASACGR